MAFRKTNIGGLITYDPKAAAKELIGVFKKKQGLYSKVAEHYEVSGTTVRRWVTTLEDLDVKIAVRIERIQEIAANL